MSSHYLNTAKCNFILMVICCFACSKSPQQSDALLSHIDSSVSAGDDFFMYANGAWFKKNPIPASEQSNGLWQLIQDTINAQIRSICETSAALKNTPKGSNKQKIGDFFFSGMDSVTLNNKGLSDLNPEFLAIDRINDARGLAEVASMVHIFSGAPMFGFYVAQDDKNSSKNAIFIKQGGLSLPDRSYYFDDDERSMLIRKQFVGHLSKMYQIMGDDSLSAQNAAQRLMKIETLLAGASRKREDTRDPFTNYNKMSFAQLLQLAPNFDWQMFFGTMGITKVDSIIVCQPEFFKAFNSSLKAFSLADWKLYLKYHLLHGLARYADDKTYNENFSFYSTTLRGIKEPKPRWKRVVEQTDASLGELIGQVYVTEYLPAGTKEKLIEIGNAIKNVYAERIKNLTWMSPATREKALRKLNAVIMKVGYPDKWKDLSTLEISRTSYMRNVMNANRWVTLYMTSKYGKPVDRTEWDMQPQTYNAYYNPSNNEIVVPGCNIIVPGYERCMADDAILYAIIGGSTFGHEITHGFDDQGCKYDEFGNLHNWWTEEDSAKFYVRTKQVVKQFDAYIPVDNLHINGELTLGENIADLGGIVMGYDAFKKTKQFKDNETIAGLTPDQRFFLGFALAWMINERPEAIANQVKADEHSPVKYRVIGSLSNMPEFYKAFNVKPGNAMWRPDSLRVSIW
jgi:putative endopeptidase